MRVLTGFKHAPFEEIDAISRNSSPVKTRTNWAFDFGYDESKIPSIDELAKNLD